MTSLLSAKEYLDKIEEIRKKPTSISRGMKPNSNKFVYAKFIHLFIRLPFVFLVMGAIGGFVSNYIIAIVKVAMQIHAATQIHAPHPILSNPITWGIIVGLIFAFFDLRFVLKGIRDKKAAQARREIQKPITKNTFGLYLGRSTGWLAELWHTAGTAPRQHIILGIKDAAQNILTLGAIGSGKTSRVIRPILLQLLTQNCGGLIFDIKGDVKETVEKFAEETKAAIKLIGIGQSRINLLSGLTPEIAASFLQSAFMLTQGVSTDAFWMQTASELCRNALGVLSFIPNHYSLENLYAYIFDEEFTDQCQQQIDEILPTLAEDQQRLLKSYCKYHDTIFNSFDEKVKSGVKATVAQVLSPFSHPQLMDAFCTTSKANLDIKDVLDGTIYLIDLPLAKWGLGGKVIYTFIKLRFFNLMQNRQIHPEWNQDRPVFFMCDEYQEIVSANKDGLSDLNFWDKARSSNTIGIISGQSVSSFEAAIGNKRLTHALLQNFRQKICFKTEDEETLWLLNRITGEANTVKTTHTHSKTSGGTLNDRSKTTVSTTKTEQREAVITAQLMRELTPNQCVALLSIAEHNIDDVLVTTPVRID